MPLLHPGQASANYAPIFPADGKWWWTFDFGLAPSRRQTVIRPTYRDNSILDNNLLLRRHFLPSRLVSRTSFRQLRLSESKACRDDAQHAKRLAKTNALKNSRAAICWYHLGATTNHLTNMLCFPQHKRCWFACLRIILIIRCTILVSKCLICLQK